jgi:hypothetical protein
LLLLLLVRLLLALAGLFGVVSASPGVLGVFVVCIFFKAPKQLQILEHYTRFLLHTHTNSIKKSATKYL